MYYSSPITLLVVGQDSTRQGSFPPTSPSDMEEEIGMEERDCKIGDKGKENGTSKENKVKRDEKRTENKRKCILIGQGERKRQSEKERMRTK